ncbi:MAG: hypothetical protein AAB365_03495 [Patescibacteria group bacterium]|mgnify:CR=1 FL=1
MKKKTKTVRVMPPAVSPARMKAAIARVSDMYPKALDMEQFNNDPAYRLLTVLRGKDYVRLVDIPPSVLVSLVFGMLDHVHFLFCQLKAPTQTLAETLRRFAEDARPKVPRGVSRRKTRVFFSFYPREFNPVCAPVLKPELKEYGNMRVVVSDAGFYLWLPVSNQLVNLTVERLEYLFQQDCFIGWHCLHGIRDALAILTNEMSRQVSLANPLLDNLTRIVGRVGPR